MTAVVQFPDMRYTPFSIIDSPMRHIVGTTVSGVMYFNAFPTHPVNQKQYKNKQQLKYYCDLYFDLYIP